MNTTSNRRLGGFLVLTFVWSWSFWLASGVLPRGGLGAYDFPWLLAQVGVFGPSLAACVVSAATGKELTRNALRLLPVLLVPLLVPGTLIAASAPAGVAQFGLLPSVATLAVGAAVVLFFSPLNRRLRSPGTGELQGRPGAGWLFLSIALLPGLFLLAWLLANLPGGAWTMAALQGGLGGLAAIVLVSFAHNLLLGGPLGEEIGWRGFLLPELLERTHPFAASLILGLIWALWHLPIDLYAGFGAQGLAAILVRIVWTLPVTILMTWFYLRTGGNLLVALLLHASLNIVPDLGASNQDVSMLVFFILMTLAAVIVLGSSPVFRRGGPSPGA